MFWLINFLIFSVCRFNTEIIVKFSTLFYIAKIMLLIQL